jgi:hypothetical protein
MHKTKKIQEGYMEAGVKRKYEEWLIDNLDSYMDEAIFVITT